MTAIFFERKSKKEFQYSDGLVNYSKFPVGLFFTSELSLNISFGMWQYPPGFFTRYF